LKNKRENTARPSRRRLLSALLLVVCVAVLLNRFANFQCTLEIAALALLAFSLLGLPAFDLRERYLLGVALIATLAAAWFAHEPQQVIGRAISQSCYLAAFMVLLSLLREAAVTSNSVLRLGKFVTRQPAGRRYLAIASGGHIISVVLNFGALSLLGPLIQRGVQHSDDDDAEKSISERRQLCALARGFSWFVTWSPTSITQALIPVVIIGSDPLLVMLLGMMVLLPVSIAGWLEDRWRYSSSVAKLNATTLKTPMGALIRFSSVCLALASLSLLLAQQTDVTLVTALMACAPLVTCAWIVLQFPASHSGMTAAMQRLAQVWSGSPAAGAPEAMAIACAGYIGICAAGALSDQDLTIIDSLAGLPPFVLYLGIPLVIPLLANFAIHPIMIVSFVGSLLAQSPALQASPTLLALSFICGWAINLTSSPFSATNLVMSRTTGISGTTLAWRWNLLFSLQAYAICAACLLLFEWLL